MPISAVTMLLCEGVQKHSESGHSVSSPDPRVLTHLLADICQVRAIGSKHSMLNQIEVRRREINPRVYGLQDRDFVADWKIPNHQPKEWIHKATHQLMGWYWERKEIENYLVDPIVVSNALGNQKPPNYEKILENAAEKTWLPEWQALRQMIQQVA
jgi:hypothetical protein